MEVVIGRHWNVTGDADLQATIQFHSLEPDNKLVTMVRFSCYYVLSLTGVYEGRLTSQSLVQYI